MEVPRGFTRCDECEGTGIENVCRWGREDGEHECDGCPCPSCSGSGLVPTEKLREEAANALADCLDAWNEREHVRDLCDPSKIARTPRNHPRLYEEADAVLRKVAEHIGEER